MARESVFAWANVEILKKRTPTEVSKKNLFIGDIYVLINKRLIAAKVIHITHGAVTQIHDDLT
jgi:hypothetical protein